MKTLVWLKNDLRLVDNRALSLALGTADPSDILIVRTKDSTPSHVPPTKRRLAVEACQIQTMQSMLRDAGMRLIDASESHTIASLAASLDASRVIANIEISEDIGYARDRAVKRELASHRIDFIETNDGGIRRGRRSRPCGRHITGARDLAPLTFKAMPEAMAALHAYLKRLPFAHYRRDMWLPGPDARASSRLSVYLACGALAGDRAIHETMAIMQNCDRRAVGAYKQFLSRLTWRQSFIQTLEDNIAAFPWAPMRNERPDDADLMQAWFEGRTGYPLVDAAMQDLASKGWVNFRLRQVVNSFALDLLDLDMHKVGVALGSLFDDYCPGIHWPQIGLQAGMAQNRGPRVINPVKQAKELDPHGTYVRSVLPYLTDIPDSHIHEPWIHPKYTGPDPIIDHARAARAARTRPPLPMRDA